MKCKSCGEYMMVVSHFHGFPIEWFCWWCKKRVGRAESVTVKLNA